MKTALLIGIAAFTVACDGSRQAQTDTSANATGGGSPGANTSAGPASGTSNSAVTVTLVGCLQGPSLSGVTGTSGIPASDRASARAAGSDETEGQSHGATHTATFVLGNAKVESGGVGANGAGATGGPVLSTGSSFELDGLPADAQASVNKQVRVTGQIDARPAAIATGTAATRAGVATPAPSTTGETSTRDDVRANSTGVAGDPTNHRLRVETVQVVAQQCGPR